MSVKTSQCETFLLDDVPASEDEFGPHQRIAGAINRLIASESGGRVIGLEGGWGTGKSTVIGFIRSVLEESDYYQVVMFDAWAHEGDPLRRTFLDAIVTRLADSEGWLNNTKWSNTLEELANRRKVTRTKVSPEPTTLGKIFAISLLLVAPGAVILSGPLNSAPADALRFPLLWVTLLGALLTFSPILVLFANFARLVFANKSGKSSDVSDWSFLLNNAVSDTRTESIESPNPTSIEFEEYFKKAMKDALVGHKKRRIILVLDNLDRVTPDDAVTIWATLQTFLQERDRGNEPWFKQIWIIVPYDPIGIRRLWDNRLGRASKDESSGNGGEDRLASDSFLDKSFQLRFQVPPPILSGWKSYLYKLIKAALPDHDADCHVLYRVYEEFRSDPSQPPTPRQLKLYVNQVGTIHRQWQHTYPLGHVAYYVLQCASVDSMLDRLRTSRFPEASAVRLLGESLKQNLAGLAFNVTAEKGMELLLEEPIYQALANADHRELTRLKEQNSDGFWAILEHVLSDRIYDSGSSVLAKAADALYSANVLEDETDAAVPSTKAMLKGAASKTESWLPFDQSVARGIGALIRLMKDLDFSNQVVQALASSIASGDEEGNRPDIQVVASSLLIVLRAAEELGQADALPRLPIPGGSEGWIAASDVFTSEPDGQKLCHYVRPKAEFSYISAAVEALIAGGDFGSPAIATLDMTTSCVDETDWTKVIRALQDRLNPAKTPGLEANEIGYVLKGLWALMKLGADGAVGALATLVSSGHIDHYFHTLANAEDTEATAIGALTILRANPSLAAPPAVRNAQAGRQALVKMLATEDRVIASSLCSVIDRYDEFMALFDVIDGRNGVDPLVATCLAIAADDSEMCRRTFSADIFLHRWRDIQQALQDGDGASFGDVISALVVEQEIFEVIRDAGFLCSEIDMYRLIKDQAGDREGTFCEWCRTGLESMDKDAWLADFSGGYNSLRFACELSGIGGKPKFTTPLADALAEHAKAVNNGQDVPDDIVEQWPTILSCLTNGVRKTLRSDLLSQLLDAKGIAPALFFTLYGNEIGKRAILQSKPNVAGDVFSPIVKERNVASLNWLVDVLRKNKGILDKLPKTNNVEGFRTRLDDCITNPEDDEAQAIIAEVAELVGIAIGSGTKESESEITERASAK